MGLKNMTIEANKQERENSQSLIRRFRQKIQRSGLLVQARKRRFYQPSVKSKQMKKRTALRREKLKAEYKKLEKLGLLKNRKR